MKNFLYQFEFFSGLFEDIFYRQINAKDEREAIIGIVAYFKDMPIYEVNEYIANIIAKKQDKETIASNNWSVQNFYDYVEWKFFNCTEGYNLRWIKEINMDLDTV